MAMKLSLSSFQLQVKSLSATAKPSTATCLPQCHHRTPRVGEGKEGPALAAHHVLPHHDHACHPGRSPLGRHRNTSGPWDGRQPIIPKQNCPHQTSNPSRPDQGVKAGGNRFELNLNQKLKVNGATSLPTESPLGGGGWPKKLAAQSY